MEQTKRFGKIGSFLLLVAYTVVVVYLTVFSLSFIMNALGAASPVLTGLCIVLLVIFTTALVMFVCALFILVTVYAIVELRDRMHFHKMVQKHRELDLQKHERVALPGTHHRVTGDLYPLNSRPRVTHTHLRSLERKDWTQP